jgi:hypothetical protein
MILVPVTTPFLRFPVGSNEKKPATESGLASVHSLSRYAGCIDAFLKIAEIIKLLELFGHVCHLFFHLTWLGLN